MVTTYWVSWQDGRQDAREGLLEVGGAAIVFRPKHGGGDTELRFGELASARRRSSTVELRRRSGDPIRVESAAASALAPCLEQGVALADLLRSLHAEHEHIAHELERLRTAVDPRRVSALIELIRAHTQLEERDLYPAVARLLGAGSLVEAMLLDHRSIEREAHEPARELDRLEALVTAHMEKEEEVVFPLLAAAGDGSGESG